VSCVFIKPIPRDARTWYQNTMSGTGAQHYRDLAHRTRKLVHLAILPDVQDHLMDMIREFDEIATALESGLLQFSERD
jgi:hypothetical protein